MQRREIKRIVHWKEPISCVLKTLPINRKPLVLSRPNLSILLTIFMSKKILLPLVRANLTSHYWKHTCPFSFWNKCNILTPTAVFFKGTYSDFIKCIWYASFTQVRRLPAVEYVEQDGVYRAQVTWGLDRIDQRSLPLDNQYSSHNGKRQHYPLQHQ